MKFLLTAALFFLAFALPPKLYAQTPTDTTVTSGGPLKPLQAIMDIRHYTIALDVNIDQQSIEGYTEVALNLSRPSDTLLFDFTPALKVSKVLVNNKVTPFSSVNQLLYITTPSGFSSAKHTVKIYYGGKPTVATRPPWVGGFSWTKDRSGNPWVNITCQFEGAKIWFPCKDHPSDEPDEGADLMITIPKGLSVAGPGLLQSVKTQNKNKTTWHWKTNYTIANYSILFNIGKYQVFKKPYTTCDGNVVPIELYVLEENAAKAQYYLDIKERDARIIEKYFGEYPWVKEKIGIAEVASSGMEHQTMVTFKDNMVFKQFPGQLDFEDIYFHEFVHEWWANKITNKDWSHMWIHEGITTYAGALALRELAGEVGYDAEMMKIRANAQRKKNGQPLVSHEGSTMKEVNLSNIYPKGAMLMHTLRYLIGDSLFFPVLKKFVTNVRYPFNQFFTSSDVEQFFNRETGMNLSPIFNFYLNTSQVIEIHVFQITPDTYKIAVKNAPAHSLPLDIVTDKGVLRTTLDATLDNFLEIKSSTTPVIDPRGWYYRQIIFE